MEYLVAVDILSAQQLCQIHRPVPMPLDMGILHGFVLARNGANLDALDILKAAMPSAIQTWGGTSLQVGIVAAESANCCNAVRSEPLAERIASRFLDLRTTRELSTRSDWFYLRVALIDAHIGQAKYQEASSELEEVLKKPLIPDTIRMLSCLRLAKVRRRMERGGKEAFRPSAPLQTGVGLLKKAPKVLQQEFLEEMACNLAIIPEAERNTASEPTELVENVNEILEVNKFDFRRSSTAWYSRIWKDFTPYTYETEEYVMDGTLELVDEGLEDGLTPGHIETVMALLRKKYANEVKMGDLKDLAFEEDLGKVIEKSDAIYEEVNKLVMSWFETTANGELAFITAEEGNEIEDILRYLQGWSYYGRIDLPGSAALNPYRRVSYY
ncbi:hypothetical protein CEP54_011932 [Fusarium duplospermum]|uniref:Uncharacterized protein n=1 Tax=Fusarium duplospermum TaxID=1325734 RepID=A0A428PBC9_9HYPO|nr:hypothetical protein CEP54_011932 [Fusarium duplospermum]